MSEIIRAADLREGDSFCFTGTDPYRPTYTVNDIVTFGASGDPDAETVICLKRHPGPMTVHPNTRVRLIDRPAGCVVFACGCVYRATDDEITCVARCERHADRKVES